MSINTLCVFEDGDYENFLPMTYTKPVFELICGSKTLLERMIDGLKPQKVLLFTRDYLKEKVAEKTAFIVNEVEVEGETLIVNGRLLMNYETTSILSSMRPGEALTCNGTLIAMKLGEGVARGALANKIFEPRLIKSFANIREVNLKSIKYPWHLIELTSELLDEISSLGEGYSNDEIRVVGDPKRLRVTGDIQVEGTVLVDVRKGPVYIGRNCMIEGYTKIEGPTYIGDDTIIRGAYIRSGCYIGKVCRIGFGSELEETVVSGFTNKQHAGFIGHSYIGEWVNIGAGTNVSDLKNTYGTIKVLVKGSMIDSGRIKLGCFVGDHAKTSIGVQIYSGKKIGSFSHVHGFVYDDVPPFTIWARSFGLEPVELTLESAIETQRRMYERRGVAQTKADVELVKKLFELTDEERARKGVKKGPFKLT